MTEGADPRSRCFTYLKTLCVSIGERCVGSAGNRAATDFFEKELRSLGWKTETQGFNAIDWKDGGARLTVGACEFRVLASPYSPGCEVTSPLVSASSISDLERGGAEGRILLVHGEIAREQLMPKGFVFYNPEEHKRIVALLENSGARAIVCATGRNPSLAGGVYPFPLIEDGDFTIPSVYMTEEDGAALLPFAGREARLCSVSERIPATGCNIVGRGGKPGSGRIALTAHIDAKKGTPGALDNATGVAVLLLAAGLLRGYSGPRQIEIVALNGEDYYAVPGQMKYLSENRDSFRDILLNINIDGAGYREGGSVFALFDLPPAVLRTAHAVMDRHPGMREGAQWPQGDHSIFIQQGVPAIAVSSRWFIENINSQEITHTPKDTIELVDCEKLVELSEAIRDLVIEL